MDQRALSGSGRTQDGDSLPLFDFETDILEDFLISVVIFERDMIKDDVAS